MNCGIGESMRQSASNTKRKLEFVILVSDFINPNIIYKNLYTGYVHGERIIFLIIGGKHKNATEDEQEKLADQARSLFETESNEVGSGRERKCQIKTFRYETKNEKNRKQLTFFLISRFCLMFRIDQKGEKSIEVQLQGVVMADNGTVHIPEHPVITGIIYLRMRNSLQY